MDSNYRRLYGSHRQADTTALVLKWLYSPVMDEKACVGYLPHPTASTRVWNLEPWFQACIESERVRFLASQNSERLPRRLPFAECRLPIGNDDQLQRKTRTFTCQGEDRGSESCLPLFWRDFAKIPQPSPKRTGFLFSSLPEAKDRSEKRSCKP
jgi:hypothetical protein